MVLNVEELEIIQEALNVYQAGLRFERDEDPDSDFDALEELLEAVNDLEWRIADEQPQTIDL
jgi:hypothetical protein